MGMLEKIELLMKKNNIRSKKALTDVTGLPYTTVAGLWTKPIDNTKRSTLFALAKALGCSVDYLGDDSIPIDEGSNRKSPELITQYLGRIKRFALEDVLAADVLTYKSVELNKRSRNYIAETINLVYTQQQSKPLSDDAPLEGSIDKVVVGRVDRENNPAEGTDISNLPAIVIPKPQSKKLPRVLKMSDILANIPGRRNILGTAAAHMDNQTEDLTPEEGKELEKYFEAMDRKAQD